MKVFKWIYYPVLILLLLALVAFGFTGVALSDSSAEFGADARAAVDKHIKSITDLGSHNAGLNGNLTSVADYIRSSVREGDKDIAALADEKRAALAAKRREIGTPFAEHCHFTLICPPH